MNKIKNKLNNKTSGLPAVNIKSNTVKSDLPASVCSPPTQTEQDREEYQLLHSIDVHLTVRSKIKLDRKTVSMLAGLVLSEVALKGISMKDWIILEYLYGLLLGHKQEPSEIYSSKERELSLCLKIVLLAGTWMGLEKRAYLPEDIQILVLSSQWVPKERTKASWTQHWDLVDFIEIRAVPMSSFLERTTGTNRYSGYCQGYGESGPAGKTQKTRYTSELDGVEPKENNQEIDIFSIGLQLRLILAEERMLALKTQNII
jgi:hypothetical protein